MIGLFALQPASRTGRAVLRYAALVLAVLLFLFSFRHAGERAGRLHERLETTERTNEARRRMLEAGADRPLDRDDLLGRLRDGGF